MPKLLHIARKAYRRADTDTPCSVRRAVLTPSAYRTTVCTYGDGKYTTGRRTVSTPMSYRLLSVHGPVADHFVVAKDQVKLVSEEALPSGCVSSIRREDADAFEAPKVK